MENNDKNYISIVQLQKPEWASRATGGADVTSSNGDNRTEVLTRDQAAPMPQPVNTGNGTTPQPVNAGSGTAPQSNAGGNTAGGGDEGGVNYEGAPVNPKNRQEAVTDHFTPKSKPETETTEQSAPKYGDYQDIIDFLEERIAAMNLPSKEDLARERRRKRTDSIISSLADGASAISNLIFTTKYAPDMYDPASSMGAKTRERYERLRKEHEAEEDRYFNYAMTIAKLKEGQDAKEYQRGRDALKDTLAQLDAANKAKLADIKYRHYDRQISDAEAAAEEKKANEELERQIKEARRDALRSQARKNDRYQPSQGRGGGGGNGRHPWRDDKGVFGKPGAIIYETSKDGAREMASTHGGTYLTTPSVVTTTKPDKWGKEQTTTRSTDTSTQRKGAGADQKPKKKTNVKWK